MAIVYSGTNDSWIRKLDNSSWANARGSATSSGDLYINNSTSFQLAVASREMPARGGGTSIFNVRSYFPFDLSGESGTATSVTLNIFSDNLGTAADEEGTVFIINSTALADSVADYGNVFSSGTTIGTVLGLIVVSTTEQPHSCTLNAAGLTAVNSAIGSGTLTIGCMGYYDYNNSAPSLGGDWVQILQYFSDATGTTRDPYLDITYGAAAATDNATFFGTNF